MSTASRSRRWPRPPRWACSMSSTASPASRSGRFRKSRCEKGIVPGEWYAPTQPIPTKPAPYARTGVIDGRVDRLHARRCVPKALELVKNYKMGPIYTPPVVSKPQPDPIGTLGAGRRQWRHQLAGRLLQSGNHTVFVYACNACMSADGPGAAAAGHDRSGYVEGHGGPAGRDGQCRRRRPGRGCAAATRAKRAGRLPRRRRRSRFAAA